MSLHQEKPPYLVPTPTTESSSTKDVKPHNHGANPAYLCPECNPDLQTPQRVSKALDEVLKREK